MGEVPSLVILAAGASSRLGAPKALARIGTQTVLERLLESGAVFDRDPPLVVAGRHHDEITRLLGSRPVEVLHHRDWAAGRTGGLQAAIARRSGRDLCIAPCDVPRVPRAVFEALRGAWIAARAPERGWLSPAVRKEGRLRFGHPVVLGRGLLQEVLSFPPDRPLRELRAGAVPLLSLEVDDPSILDDLDEPDDLARWNRPD